MLTGLSNRYHLEATLQEMPAQAKQAKHSVAVLFIDLDGFKEVNNSFGHSKGDAFLKIMAQRLRSLVTTDDTIARIGGDEFVLVLGKIKELSSVVERAQNILETVNQEHTFMDAKFFLGASIGISLFPKHDSDIEALINLADKAMYKVKESTKNSFLFYEERMGKN